MKNRMKLNLLFTILLLLLEYNISNGNPQKACISENVEMKIDSSRYPSFSHSNVLTFDRDRINTKSIIDEQKITILVLWAWWCNPCKSHFDAYAKKYVQWQKDYNVEIIAIEAGSDRWSKDKSKIKALIDKHNWPWGFYYDLKNPGVSRADLSKSIEKTFIMDNVVYPVTLVVMDGVVLERFVGYNKGDEDGLEFNLSDYHIIGTILNKLNFSLKKKHSLIRVKNFTQ